MLHGTGICTYIYHKFEPNVGKYTTIHGAYGVGIVNHEKKGMQMTRDSTCIYILCTVSFAGGFHV